MKKTLHMIAVLACVGLISGLALVFVYRYAAPLIAENRATEMKAAIFKIFPDAKSYKEKPFTPPLQAKAGQAHLRGVYEVMAAGGKILGYAFLAEGNGYQGPIKIMAGLKPDLETLWGVEILESQETPGLGQEITTDKFRAQFKGLGAASGIVYVKNVKPSKRNEIQAITGATVSSSAVVGILNERIREIRKSLGDSR